MGSRRPSISHELSLTDFKKKRQELTVVREKNENGWQGRSFVRGGALTTWLASPTASATFEHPCSNAEALLDKTFPDREHLLPLSHEDVLRGDKKCPLMFCILMEMDHGDLVGAFRQYGIYDASLPMTPDDLHRSIRLALSRFDAREITELADGFYNKQWEYFPLPLSYDMLPLPLEKRRILPICQKSLIMGGRTAKIYMIAVTEDYVDPKLKNSVPSSAFTHKEYGRCYQFVLKSFVKESQELFNAEIIAYQHLRNQEYVIKYFGGFCHFDEETSDTTHSILLEYGECDLSEYFGYVIPPALREDVESFWSLLFNVIGTVGDIHSFKAHRGGRLQDYEGWHGDIKPSNILMVERQLKLADPGFANFVRSRQSQDHNGVPRVLNGWTSTYGPPEVNENDSSVSEPWAVDMWSIGCVLSEAATWIVLTDSGRPAFSSARRDAINSLDSSRSRNKSSSDELGNCDYFHDGRTVLPAVSEWHEMLRSLVRPNDNITKQVLDLVDKHLLIAEPNDRIRARDLCSELNKMLEYNRQDQQEDVIPPQFKQAIREARNRKLQTWTSISQSLEGLSFEDRKPHDSTASALLTRIPAVAEVAVPTRVSQYENRQSKAIRESSDSGLSEPSNQYQISSQYDYRPGVVNRTSTTMTSDDGTYFEVGKTRFDAYYEREATEAALLDRLTGRSKRAKNDVLSSYYDKRDIIFLVDNGFSMTPFWSEVKFTLRELVGISRNLDENGMDLMFTRSTKVVKNAKSKALDLFTKAIGSDDVTPRKGVNTNMAEKLGGMLFQWRESFTREPSKTRKMTIIVLTDGRWHGSLDDDVDQRIVSFSKQAKNLNGFSDLERPVSIQFVSFGKDPMALARLQRLDDRLHYYKVEDIVDTEPSSGSIYKMLLGSFVEQYDEQNSGEPMIGSSPPISQQSFPNNVPLPSPVGSRSSNLGFGRSHSSRSSEMSDGVPQSIPQSHSRRTSRPDNHRVPRPEFYNEHQTYPGSRW